MVSDILVNTGLLPEFTWSLPELMLTCHQRNSLAFIPEYRQVSNIRRTLVGNKIVDHSDVVGASPVGAAPTTSSFST